MNSTEEDNLNKDPINEESTNGETMNSKNSEPKEIKIDEASNEIEEKYKFGWSSYSEITNGRFAMIGFLAIILIELLSQKSFLNWAGIL